MSEFKGTKGEWKIDSSKGIYADSETEIITGNIICDAPVYFNASMKNWRANAKLISCAPLMLEMLEKVYEKLECGALGYDIQQLIKKATQ